MKFPSATRPWALPVLIDLYRSREDNPARGRRHRTPAQLLCRLLRLRLLRFPGRAFVFVGDSGYGTHAVARLGHRHRARLTLVSQLHPDANRFRGPPRYTGRGRPVPAVADPADGRVVRRGHPAGGHGDRDRARVQVGLRPGPHPLGVRRGPDRDAPGGVLLYHRPGPDPGLGHHHRHGSVEPGCDLPGVPLLPGLETTRGWCRATVLRAAPGLFGRYSVVAALYRALPADRRVGAVRWPGKAGVTFADALTAVRRWLSADAVFPQAAGPPAVQKLPPPLCDLVLSDLTTAASHEPNCISRA